MDDIGTSELSRLTRQQRRPCVTVYLPTYVSREEGRQDPVRLKNLLRQAEEQLADGWLRATEARQLLQDAHELPSDRTFWEERSHGLAIFVSPESFDHFRLPLRFEELVVVNQRFHVKPLLPLLAGGNRFFILALSQNRVRLFAASHYGIQNVDVPGLPANMKDALNYAGADRGSQVHSAMQGSLGKQAAVFHGQGGHSETRKDDLAQFFRMIDAALRPVLRDEKAPLLLAGVEYLLPIYRAVNSYSHIAKQELDGNCDHLSAHQMHQRAWPVVEPLFQRVREDAAAEYRKLAGTGQASHDIRQIVPAAHEGRIDTLFVDVRAFEWGVFDQQTRTVELHNDRQAGDDDLLDLAAVETFVRRGTVHCVERQQFPSDEAVAAVFRY